MPPELAKEKRERLNLLWTILGPIIVSGMLGLMGKWIVWSIDSKFQMERAEIKEHYVSVQRFEEAHRETKLSLDKLSDSVSHIQGEIDITVKTHN